MCIQGKMDKHIETHHDMKQHQSASVGEVDVATAVLGPNILRKL